MLLRLLAAFAALALLLWAVGGRDARRRAGSGREGLVVRPAAPRAPPPRPPSAAAAVPPEEEAGAREREIDALLDYLQADEHREEAEERGRRAARLRALVREAGPALVEEALRTAHRKRSQLLLAQVETLPRARLERIARESRSASARLMARLRLGEARELEPDPHAFGRGVVPEPDPLRALDPELLVRPGEADRTKDAFQREFRERIAVMIRDAWKHVPPEDRWLVDLDGDGSEEYLVVSDAIGSRRYSWRASFWAILGRDGSGEWRVRRGRRFEYDDTRIRSVVVADLDRNGLPEAVIRHTRGRYPELTVVGAEGDDHCWGLEPRRIPALDGPRGLVRFVSGRDYRSSRTGTWGIRLGVLASERVLLRWTGRALVREATAYVPVGR